MKIRILALLCAAILALGTLSACKKNGGQNEGTPTSGNSGGTGELSAGADTIGKYDFEMADFKILSRTSTKYEFESDDENSGSLVSEKIVSRNSAVEERFNVKFDFKDAPGDDPNRSAFTTMIQTNFMSGSSEWDLVSAHGTVISPLQFRGYCMDMTTLPEFDVQKEWWSSTFYNECNFWGKLYFSVGDIAYTLYEYLEVLYVNEKAYIDNAIGESGNVDAFYDLVRNGDWTYETFKSYVKQYECNPDAPERNYGLALNLHSWRAMLPATEMLFTYRDEDENIKLYEKISDRMSTFYSDFKSFLFESNKVYCPNVNSNDASTQNSLFTAGRLLFYGQELGQLKRINGDIGFNFGVVPFPKYTDLQESYHTTCRNSVSAIMVPVNVSDPTMSGVITEALCMYSYRNVIPAYYEVVLTLQVIGTPNGQDMMKIIRDSFMIDFSLAYTFGFGSIHPYTVFKKALFATSDSLTSEWENEYSGMNNALEKMYSDIIKVQVSQAGS